MDLISEEKLRNIAAEREFNIIYFEKDYFLTILLYFLRECKDIYLKGGTALNKVLFDHLRLSEDLDFTCKVSVAEIKKNIEEIVKKEKVFFTKIEYENENKDFVRIKVFYKSFFAQGSYIIIDLNAKASIHLKPESRDVHNFYDLAFSVNILNPKELIAEKLRAAITRNQARDYFDLYFILNKYIIDIDLVKKKTEEANEHFDLKRVFKNANKIYSRWDEEIGKLTNAKLSFNVCIKLLNEKLRKLK